jgi:uroporphyrin-III C-methyltransferase
VPVSERYRADLPVAGRPVTVFGGDGPALGHVCALRDAGAAVTVVATKVAATVTDLAQRGLVTWREREYTEADLDDPWLVVALTGDPALDRTISRASERRRLWCVTSPPRRSRTAGHGKGRVVLVGGGPGDPGLLTVAGREALQAADVVVADRLAPLAALADLDPAVEVVDVGKVPGGRATPQAEINRLLVEHATAGHDVVRLKGGDSFLFGRGGEEMQACVSAGIEVAVVPGVTSALAVPAAAGIPVTHRGLNQGFTVVSGHVPPSDPRSTVDYAALARAGTPLVLLMAVANLSAISQALVDGGLPPDTPSATIADGTLTSQQVVRAPLIDIGDAVARAGLAPPAVTVIGAVAAFDPAEALDPAGVVT